MRLHTKIVFTNNSLQSMLSNAFDRSVKTAPHLLPLSTDSLHSLTWQVGNAAYYVPCENHID